MTLPGPSSQLPRGCSLEECWSRFRMHNAGGARVQGSEASLDLQYIMSTATVSVPTEFWAAPKQVP